MLLAGKALSGLFGGTFPIMLTWVAEFTVPDFELLKKRTLGLVGCLMSAPIALVPVGGAASKLLLELPFFVAAGAGLLATVLAVTRMQEAAAIKAINRSQGEQQQGDNDNGKERAQAGAKQTEAARDRPPLPTGSPWCDRALVTFGIGGSFITGFMMTTMLMPPLQLQQPKFGVAATGQSDEDTQRDISFAVGYVSLLGGVLNLCGVGAALPLQKRAGLTEQQIVVLACATSAASACAMPRCDSLGQLALALAGMMAGMGLAMGVATPLPNKYLTRVWPKKMAQGRAVYNQLMSFGMMLWPMPFAVIYRSRGGTYTEGVYYLSAGLIVIAGLFLRAFMRMVDSRLRELGFESEFNNAQAAPGSGAGTAGGGGGVDVDVDVVDSVHKPSEPQLIWPSRFSGSGSGSGMHKLSGTCSGGGGGGHKSAVVVPGT